MTEHARLGDLTGEVIVLILIAFGMAIWSSRRYQYWIRKKYQTFPKWGPASVWGVRFVLFLSLAVVFGFVIDTFQNITL